MAAIKSVEEKARAYDEIMGKAKKELDACGSQDCDAARQIFRFFPELKESEDEKIRKAIINVFASHKNYEVFFGVSVEDILAWLEKQGEQKPAWSEEDESRITVICTYLQDYARLSGSESRTIRINEYCDWLKSLRPHNTWKPSDEQMKCLSAAIEESNENSVLESLYQDLKKLREE